MVDSNWRVISLKGGGADQVGQMGAGTGHFLYLKDEGKVRKKQCIYIICIHIMYYY